MRSVNGFPSVRRAAAAERHGPRAGHALGHLAGHHLVLVPLAPAAVGEAAAGVLVRAAEALHHAVEGDPHRNRDRTHEPAPVSRAREPRGPRPLYTYTNARRRRRHQPRLTRSSFSISRPMSTGPEVSTWITGPSPGDGGGSPHSSWSLRSASRWPACRWPARAW